MRWSQPIRTRAVGYLKRKAFYSTLRDERDRLENDKNKLERVVEGNKAVIDYQWFAEPGHFYSPLINGAEGKFDHLVDLWNPKQQAVPLPGINLNTAEQWKLLSSLGRHSQDMESYIKKAGVRFRFDNDQLGKCDTGFLYHMLRQLKPKQIIEVGSGWSSALMLDVNELYPRDAANLTFIDPYADRLRSALRRQDQKRCEIIEQKVQSVGIDRFMKLRANDLLFIDNSHVSKSGSDVNFLFFEVLPRLQAGVIVHVHDIFYPFEYPWQWVVEDKRNWNEAYVLHALLSDSNVYEIIMWPSYLMMLDRNRVKSEVPNATDLGSSIWLRKVA
jgi:predicted O-methyltransferase YrrM